MVGVSPPTVTAYRRRGGIPPERRPAIELHKWPEVCVEQLGDDVHWVRVPDPDWPHPDGRPCLDVARAYVNAANGGALAHGAQHRAAANTSVTPHAQQGQAASTAEGTSGAAA